MFIFPTLFIMTIHIYFKKWLTLNIFGFFHRLLPYSKIDVETGNEIVIDDYHMRLTHLVLVDTTAVTEYYHYVTKFYCNSTHAINKWDKRWNSYYNLSDISNFWLMLPLIWNYIKINNTAIRNNMLDSTATEIWCDFSFLDNSLYTSLLEVFLVIRDCLKLYILHLWRYI